MFTLGSRSLFVTSVLSFVASVVYAGQSTDRLGLAILVTAAVLSAFLGAAAMVGTGAADRFVYTGDIDASRSVAVPSSFAPICAAVGTGCLVGGAALGAPLYAAAIVIAGASGVAWFISAGQQNPNYVPAVAKRVSDGIAVPFGLPVVAFGLIAIIAISISRTLLAVGKTASWIVVLIFAAAVFFGGILLALRPRLTRRMMTLGVAVTVVAVVAMAAAGLIAGQRKFEHHEEKHGNTKEAKASPPKTDATPTTAAVATAESTDSAAASK